MSQKSYLKKQIAQDLNPAKAILSGGESFLSFPIEKLVDDDAEEAVIASILIYNAYEPMSSILEAEDFYLMKYQLLWKAAAEVFNEGQEIDLISLGAMMRQKFPEEWDAIGQVAFLTGIMSSAKIHLGNHMTYASLVKDNSKRRRAVVAATDIAMQCFDLSVPYSTIAHRIESIIDLQIAPAKEAAMQTAYSLAEEVAHYVDQAQDGLTDKPISTGLIDLDRIIGGWYNRRLAIVTASTGIGKSTFLYNQAWYALKQGRAAAIWTLEITKRDVMFKMAALQSGVSVQLIRDGKMNSAQYGAFLEGLDWVRKQPLYINDSSSTTPREIFREAKRISSAHERSPLILIDYFQKLGVPADKRSDNMAVNFKWISEALIRTAKDLDLPVVAAVQAKAEVSQRRRKKDQFPGETEQQWTTELSKDTDVNIALWRDKDFPDGSMACRVYKSRPTDRTGGCEFFFDDSSGRMMNGQRRIFHLSDHHKAAGSSEE
jgi:replicative DNA helicase